MAKQKNRPHNHASWKVHEGTKKAHGRHIGFSKFMEFIHSENALQLFAGVCQIFLGLSVVLVSVLGLVQPLWLSIFLCIVASVTTMTGIYFCYLSFPVHKKDSLLRNAMRRIVEEQN